MDLGQGLLLGLSIVVTPSNILLALFGALLGTLVGILPGLGATATMAILLPVTFGMEPTSAMVMLVAMSAGARYGGAVTSICMNLPGESSAVLTCLDGYQLALKGRAGPALGLAAISSFVGGTVGVLGLMFLAPVMATVAVGFGPPEYFALTLLGLCLVTSLTGKSVVKGLLAAVMGLLLSTVGLDLFTGANRLTFARLELLDGISFINIAVGLFAVGEILINMEKGIKFSLMEIPTKISQLLPNSRDITQCIGTWVKSTILGFIVGVLPGAGATVASFLAYTVAKTTSRNPESFGKGAIEGVAASESADNASNAGALLPMLTIGIPGSASTAMLMAILMMFSLRPGPLMLIEHPEIFWTVVATLWVSNIMLVIINIPFIPVIVQFLRIPYYLLYILILVIASIAVYSINYSSFDLWLMAISGVVGYYFKKMDYPPAALLLALILGPLVERALRQSLIMSSGSLDIFFSRPVTAGLLAIAVVALLAPWFQQLLIARSRPARDIAVQ